MFSHYGFVTTKFFPVKSHGRLEAGDLVNTLAPLAPYANKLLIPRGIRAMNEWTADRQERLEGWTGERSSLERDRIALHVAAGHAQRH